MEKKRRQKNIDIDNEYLAILNSDYFNRYPDDGLITAFEVLHGDGVSGFFDCYPFTHQQAFEIKKILESKFRAPDILRISY